MSNNRPYVISIAGFDPSAGAGVLADVKCFEQHQTYGFGVCSALTVQTDRSFLKNEWLDTTQIINQLKPLMDVFKITACKIGLIKDLTTLKEVIEFLKSSQPDLKIIIDPILKASAGYQFHDWNNGIEQLLPVLKLTDLITPNYNEILSMGNHENVNITAAVWAQYCPVLLKGGHNISNQGIDYLFEQGHTYELKPTAKAIKQKHGSGCVLSAAITANIALGHQLPEACKRAKNYIETFLNSNPTLLGYHSL